MRPALAVGCPGLLRRMCELWDHQPHEPFVALLQLREVPALRPINPQRIPNCLSAAVAQSGLEEHHSQCHRCYGSEGKLQVRIYREDNCVVVETADNGPGISPEVQPISSSSKPGDTRFQVWLPLTEGLI